MIFKYLVLRPKNFKFYKKYNVTVGLEKMLWVPSFRKVIKISKQCKSHPFINENKYVIWNNMVCIHQLLKNIQELRTDFGGTSISIGTKKCCDPFSETFKNINFSQLYFQKV